MCELPECMRFSAGGSREVNSQNFLDDDLHVGGARVSFPKRANASPPDGEGEGFWSARSPPTMTDDARASTTRGKRKAAPAASGEDIDSAALTSRWPAQKTRRGTVLSTEHSAAAAKVALAASTVVASSATAVVSLATATAAAAASAARKPESKFKPRPIAKVDRKVPVVDGGAQPKCPHDPWRLRSSRCLPPCICA